MIKSSDRLSQFRNALARQTVFLFRDVAIAIDNTIHDVERLYAAP